MAGEQLIFKDNNYYYAAVSIKQGLNNKCFIDLKNAFSIKMRSTTFNSNESLLRLLNWNSFVAFFNKHSIVLC